MSPRLSPEELREIDAAIDRALSDGDTSQLRILGYGEISAVVAWPSAAGELACKRLPLFDDERRARDYASCVEEYLVVLAERGVTPLETSVQSLRRDDAAIAVYCVQPVLEPASLLNVYLSRCREREAEDLFERVLGRVASCVCARVGLDGQASNWVVVSDDAEGPGELAYLDVSTPMLRDARGRERLDTDLFLASLPWALQGVVRRLLLGTILDKYYDVRGVALDFLGNLHKEGLAHLVPPLLRIADRTVTPALTEDEVLRYYRSDAGMWEALQRLRRADRFWQRRVRGRPYPFLLPGRILRHV